MEILSPEELSDAPQPSSSIDDDQRVYLVPFRWWKEAQDSSSIGGDLSAKRGVLYTASSNSSYAGAMKLINNIFSSDLMFNLRRDEGSTENGEVGVSGRDYALVSGEMWLQALKWHSDSKSTMKRNRSFSVGEVDIADVYPLQLRLSVLREANLLGVKISKKGTLFQCHLVPGKSGSQSLLGPSPACSFGCCLLRLPKWSWPILIIVTRNVLGSLKWECGTPLNKQI